MPMEVAIKVDSVLPAVRISEFRDFLNMPNVFPLPFLSAAIGWGRQAKGFFGQVHGAVDVAPVRAFTWEELGRPDPDPDALVLIGNESLLLNLLLG